MSDIMAADILKMPYKIVSLSKMLLNI